MDGHWRLWIGVFFQVIKMMLKVILLSKIIRNEIIIIKFEIK